ncbi:uncharacterized protein LOC132699708 isoform X2 [Cylas formicarius]|uniref:uncharacterized protein LOC132699708 isoform X2 n=1 Tax=Cylas formicarius TaxID=197179 RepID=UPI002958485F|nr:uncharacterized protein LOC132699708 isoform X2 [Cylas formicarius]
MVYKERLIDGWTKYPDFWRKLTRRRQSTARGCKFTLNRLYETPNLRDQTIYECSEESQPSSLSYVYRNPLYAHAQKTPPYDLYSARRRKLAATGNISTKKGLKTEKYVIRHVKVRIMLSLRIGQKRKPKKMTSTMGGERRQSSDRRFSTKTQTVRHGRLNVLRWLLWESGDGAMPALEKGGSAVNSDGSGADEAHSHRGSTTLALHYAAARGCLDCVRLLVDTSKELSANTQMDNDVTPVYLAAQEGHLDVLKFLVTEAGGSLYVRAKDGMAPIHAASQMGCLNCVKWMIQDQGVDPNLRDGDGATPLHFAASRGHLETVRWLLRHGARLSLDKYGKSPINDAAENQQVECLNVLVQHGTTPDYQDSEKESAKSGCSCCKKGERVKRLAINQGGSVGSDCSRCKPKIDGLNDTEPFYLHPPLNNSRSLEPAHAPENGLYINPMNKHRHSASSCSETSSNDSINGESFYLHNPQQVIYNRVKDLFDTNGRRQSLSGLTVKVEVHSSSSGAGSDENLSSSDLSSVKSNEHEHDYEDIYLVREEFKKRERNEANRRSRSTDSGSHSRSGSVSSSNSGGHVTVKKSNEFLPKPQRIEKFDKKANNADQSKIRLAENNGVPAEDEPDKTTYNPSHTLPAPPTHNNNKALKRVSSVPVEIGPPPPPPPPQPDLPAQRAPEIVEVVEEPTLKPSDIVKASRRLNASCSDLTSVTLAAEDGPARSIVAAPCNRQRVLPFVPPSFPSADPNRLIKPSEYLRSISTEKRTETTSLEPAYQTAIQADVEGSDRAGKKDDSGGGSGPPPPPLPEFNGDLTQTANHKPNAMEHHQAERSKKQPLSAISIQDLNSVQLRRTDKMVASKTFSAPTRSVSLQCLSSTTESFMAQKTDLIAELKMSKDITGIKKMKIEKAKTNEVKEKELYVEISKQFTAATFVEKIPDKDNTGNLIPAWKRQMLAKKAAEKARKEMEDQLQREAEEKRLQSIPPWKRQLLAKKEETEKQIRQTIYTPRVVDEPKITKLTQENYSGGQSDAKATLGDENNNNDDDVIKMDQTRGSNAERDSDDESRIIPWRAQLRKTRSSLNLLG